MSNEDRAAKQIFMDAHLAVFGSADRLVPVEESVAAFSAAACTTGRHPLATMTIHVVPGADHRLRTGADAVPAAHQPGLPLRVDHERGSGLSQVMRRPPPWR